MRMALTAWGEYPMPIMGSSSDLNAGQEVISCKQENETRIITNEEVHMDGVLEVLSVVGLFMLRIGVPVLLLVALGIAIDRWQSRREEYIDQRYGTMPETQTAEQEDEAEEQEKIHKAA
jgi:hypothetical protein